MSVQQPWAYLIGHGYKKCENRDGNPPKAAVGEYVAIHVTKIQSAQKRHAAYQNPVVQRYLESTTETHKICSDNQALDRFFEGSIKSVIGVVKLEAIIDKKGMNPEERRACQEKYPFYDVGLETNKKLLFGKAYLFPDPIPDVKGVLGIRELNDPKALKEVRRGMADVEYSIACMQQQQDNDEQSQEVEEKHDMVLDEDDDDVCPVGAVATATGTPRFETILSAPPPVCTTTCLHQHQSAL